MITSLGVGKRNVGANLGITLHPDGVFFTMTKETRCMFADLDIDDLREVVKLLRNYIHELEKEVPCNGRETK